MTTTGYVLLLAGMVSISGGVACADDPQPPARGETGETNTDESSDPSTSKEIDASPAPVSSADASSPMQTDDDAGQRDASSPGAPQDEPDANASPIEPAPDGGTGPQMTSSDLDASDASHDSALDADAHIEPAEFAPPRGPCATADRIGRFIIESQASFGVIQGTVSVGVVPTSVPEIVADDGTCRLDERRTLVCLPACESGETCGENGECIAYPARMSVGEVAIEGLTQPTQLSPQNPGFIYVGSGTPNPPYTPGSEIVLTATGSGDTPRFDLFGVGSTPLTQEPNWVIDEGEDLAVSWQSAGSNVATTVLVELTIDQHGTSPLSLSCEFPDTGSAHVPARLVDQMLGAGVSGFPNGRITRRTADHVNVPLGCVELAVGSPRAASVTVTGHIPCHDNDDCPNGQTCNTAIEQCQD